MMLAPSLNRVRSFAVKLRTYFSSKLSKSTGGFATVMNTVRRFSFERGSIAESIDVLIPEVIDSDYGFYVWPCAPVLAQYIMFNRENISGKTTLELGAGTALPTIVAAKCGATVHVSDSTDRRQTLENARKSMEMNEMTDVPVHGITWGRIDETLTTLPKIDIILASDCFYDTKDFEDVIVTFAYLLRHNPEAEVWCTYQERSESRSIEHLLQKWKIDCVKIKLSSFDAERPNIADSGLPEDHSIHMYIFKSVLCSMKT